MDIDIKPLNSFFDDSIVAQRVYYIIGFVCCQAGEKEAKCRSKHKNVGVCIEALKCHFSNDYKKIATIKSEVPDGLAGLVDKRCAFGSLQYPDKDLYHTFTTIELVYSHLATPHIFMIFGGTLLSKICGNMIENTTIVCLFSALFTSDKFDDETIIKTLQYCLKVFGNVRARDLCYHFNSNLNNSATAGLQQSLARIKSAVTKKGKPKKEPAENY